MLVPEDLKYAETHEWVRIDKTIGTVGITDHAQAELTDIVFVELPKVGAKVTAKQQAAVVESVKAASDIYSPVSGEVTEVNSELESSPALVNTAPYAEGWLFKVQLEEGVDLPELKDAAAYRAQIGAE
ncbi:MAG: glycine cleavage system protein GcvH [Verrucomicrobia bacterium]|nr:glycine cleavage system protein GcvH [Verrucomicrobiota bacterium]MBV8485499.1 glycine cleavage system protein GcvH [Verrucomicrobiota bacterium]